MDLSSIPHSPGVYLMRDRTASIIYVGKAKDLYKRVSTYFLDKDHEPKVAAMVALVSHLDYIPTASEREALVMERELIHKLQPHFNIMWRDDKSFPWVKVSMGEDYPRLFITRRRLRDKGSYFGPYPNTRQVRGLLRYLWRARFFPLRPCHYEFSEANPLDPAIIKGCLYYHTRECPAPCAKRISKDDYRRIAHEAELFFQGRYKPLIQEWENEMRQAAANRDYERAAELRDHVGALQHMNERMTFREIRWEDVSQRMGRSRAITDLQSALQLKKPPVRIECFDISHIQGAETVASCVVFEHGRPLKSDYRKFIIRSVAGIDDFASMGEVVGRRYRRLRDEKRALPDLVLIDGGKGQLSAAVAAIEQQLGKARPPVASLAKQQEELFLPTSSESIRLAKDSPALHLVQAVRDEAHRFAITFHRSRRSKKMLAKTPSPDTLAP